MKTAVVTGGARGIGEAVCERLCRDGYSVTVNWFHSEEKAASLVKRLTESGFDAFAVKADVSNSADADMLISAAVKRNGRLDVLVNNAGVAVRSFFDETTDEQWRRVMDTNLTGAFNCARAASKQMLRQKNGRIINISSMWGQTGASCEVAYSASKAGVIGLTKALAKELAPSGITVNCVCPGVIDTDMMASFSQEDRRLIADDIPLGRFGSPDDIANAVAFFADERSSFVTGQILGVNGGSVI